MKKSLPKRNIQLSYLIVMLKRLKLMI